MKQFLINSIKDFDSKIKRDDKSIDLIIKEIFEMVKERHNIDMSKFEDLIFFLTIKKLDEAEKQAENLTDEEAHIFIRLSLDEGYTDISNAILQKKAKELYEQRNVNLNLNFN